MKTIIAIMCVLVGVWWYVLGNNKTYQEEDCEGNRIGQVLNELPEITVGLSNFSVYVCLQTGEKFDSVYHDENNKHWRKVIKEIRTKNYIRRWYDDEGYSVTSLNSWAAGALATGEMKSPMPWE